MEKRGIPSVVICTDEFLSLGKSIAEFLGMPTLKIVSIPHPLGGLEKEDVLKRAEAAYEEIAGALTASGQKARAKAKAKA